MLSPVRLSSVRCLSLTLVRPTQPVEIFGNISTSFGTWPSIDIHEKFYGDHPRETPSSGELNTRGVAKYSDFGHIEGYISGTVQARGGKLVLITNGNSYMSFRLVPTSVTLDDLEGRNSPYFVLFHRIGYFPGCTAKKWLKMSS